MSVPLMKAFSLFIDKKQKKFFEKPNNQKLKTKKLNKMSIFQLRQFSIFFSKISWIGPWVSRID